MVGLLVGLYSCQYVPKDFVLLWIFMAGNDKKLGHLWRLEGAKERLRLVRADLMVEGSFDDAIMGCDGVFHSASPVLDRPASDPKANFLLPFLSTAQ